MKWCCVSNPKGGREPEWKRSAALADDGVVFAPAIITGNEMVAFLAASWDGTPVVMNDDHLYLPVQWIAREYPDVADVCAEIEARVKAHFGAI